MEFAVQMKSSACGEEVRAALTGHDGSKIFPSLHYNYYTIFIMQALRVYLLMWTMI